MQHGAPFRWWVTGGHALELHCGTSWRSHDDLDIGICRQDADHVYRWLSNWDVFVAAGTDQRWVYRRDEEVSRPWGDTILWTSDGVPYLAPELQLLFKTNNPRDKDHRDARHVMFDDRYPDHPRNRARTGPGHHRCARSHHHPNLRGLRREPQPD